MERRAFITGLLTAPFAAGKLLNTAPAAPPEPSLLFDDGEHQAIWWAAGEPPRLGRPKEGGVSTTFVTVTTIDGTRIGTWAVAE